MIITSKWAPFVDFTFQDSLGRWVGATLKGDWDNKLTIITAQRCNSGNNNDGMGSDWSQLCDCHTQQAMENNSSIEGIDPRRIMLRGLQKLIATFKIKGHKICLLTDADKERDIEKIKLVQRDCQQPGHVIPHVLDREREIYEERKQTN